MKLFIFSLFLGLALGCAEKKVAKEHSLNCDDAVTQLREPSCQNTIRKMHKN